MKVQERRVGIRSYGWAVRKVFMELELLVADRWVMWGKVERV